MAITDRLLSPHDCTLCIGLPLDATSFTEAQSDPNRDFAAQFYGGWPQYEVQVCNDIARLRSQLSSLGCTVLAELRLDDFSRVMRSGCSQVIILFSHWTNESIEFFDGLMPYSQVLSAIPEDFDGILDLCVCHPVVFVDAIVRARPGCLVRFLPREADPGFWCVYYVALMRMMSQGRITYTQAMERLTLEILTWANKRRLR
jgi:hypothetical protein